MNLTISPKVWVPAVGQVVVGVALALITGDQEPLIVALTGLSTALAGFFAPPAGGLTQDEVEAQAARQRPVRR